ncbi:hypothetical protein Tco_1213217 [Tanacetum coccineum]
MEDVEIKLNPLKDSDDSVPIPRVSVTPLDSIDSILDSYDTSYTNPSDLDSESTLNYGLTSDKSMQDIILQRIRHGMVNSSRLSFYLDLFFLEDNFGSLSSDSFELGFHKINEDPCLFSIYQSVGSFDLLPYLGNPAQSLIM